MMDINSELYDYLDEEELDNMRAVLAYILMEDTDLDGDDIYDLIFRDKRGRGGRGGQKGRGERITWH